MSLTGAAPIVRPALARNIVIWTGAGVSADAPTCGPTGRQLTDRALDEYFEPGASDHLKALYACLAAPNAEYRPRLETVLDALAETYGLAGLADVLSDLADARPNRHHEALHAVAADGARIVTANFDTCIERAGTAPIEIAHFHGAIGPGHDIATLGARLSVIEKGFPEAVGRAIRQGLEGAPIDLLVFLGYSGSDFFDATPFLLTWLAGRPVGQVIWHVFRSGPLEFGRAESATAPDLAVRIAALGHDVIVARGTLDDLIPALVSRSTRGPVGAAPAATGAPTRWRPAVLRGAAERRGAKGALLVRLGYRTGVLGHFAVVAPQTTSEWIGLADACWGAGQYTRAWDAWEHAYLDSTGDHAWHRRERRGAFLWITGRFLRAEHLLWHAVLESADDPACSRRAEAALLRTYGRVFVHMRRTPDTRLFARGRRRAHVLERAEKLLLEHFSELASEDLVDLRNVVAALAGTQDSALSEHVTQFEEREHLSAWLNYSHSLLRDRAGNSVPELHPTRVEYREQARREHVLGSSADEMRAMLIPGAERHFTLREFAGAVRPVEMSRWNRLRFLAGFAALRSRAVLSRRSTTAGVSDPRGVRCEQA